MKKKTTPCQQNHYHAQDITCSRNHRILFQSLTITVRESQILEIQGDNGSGKTSLLKILAGIIKPDSGVLFWNGQENHLPQDKILYIGHELGLADELTLFENLVFWARARRCRDEKACIDKALQTLAIAHLATTPITMLSQGQKKRTALARLVISADAPLWFLDEPFAHLDTLAQQKTAQLIETARHNGSLVILTSHVKRQNVPHTITVAL